MDSLKNLNLNSGLFGKLYNYFSTALKLINRIVVWQFVLIFAKLKSKA